MSYNPSMFEINTRVWLKKFSGENPNFTISDVPSSYWDYLKEKGIDYIWLMGIWKTSPIAAKKYAFEPNLVKNYKSVLRNWAPKDVIGSPYAIDVYDIDESLGSIEDLLDVKLKLNNRGMKLILDYVPNHFSAETILLQTHQDIFLYTTEEHFQHDKHTYFKPFENEDCYFAHGRDPFFPAWQDTVQVNYFSITARDFMANTLMQLTDICDGLRCDMAMLALNNVFQNTWSSNLNQLGFEKPEDEFWKTAIDLVRKKRDDFIFIAEVYWDLEWEMQQLGFNYTYDKKLTDRLKDGHAQDIRGHLNATADYQSKSLRFIENHDENRSITSLGVNKAKAAAVIISTICGMHFYFDGQFEGKRVKLPVQLGREPLEKPNKSFINFYNHLLNITKHDIFKIGSWRQLKPDKCSENDFSFYNILAWKWEHKTENRLVVVNFSNTISICLLKLNIKENSEKIVLTDLLNNIKYEREKHEIEQNGLFIKLGKYESHIFSY